MSSHNLERGIILNFGLKKNMMKDVFSVYLAYVWVGLLHALFVGVTLYVFFGKWLKKQYFLIPCGIILIILAFFELYWIPVFNNLGIKIFIDNNNIHQHFGITAKNNLVQTIRPNWISYLFWLGSTALAYIIGNYIYDKKIIK